MKMCPTCQQPMPYKIKLSGHRCQELLEYVRGKPSGVTSRQIIEAVWADAPKWWALEPNIVAVNVRRINLQLEALGVKLRIRGTGGPGSVYRAVYL